MTPATPSSQHERFASIEEAISLAHDEAARLGHRLTIEVIGGQPHATTAGRLIDERGRIVCRSSGKGLGPQSVASAALEALEHHYLSSPNNRSCEPGMVRILPWREVGAQPEARPHRTIGRLSRLWPEERVACVDYQRWDSGSATLAMPIALSDVGYRDRPLAGDTFDYAPLLTYCSTSGAATGVRVEDALLHAVLEVIERDALSLALLEWYVCGAGEVRSLSLGGLPTYLRTLHRHVETVVGAEVAIIDVTSDVGVPAYLAAPRSPRHGSNLCGSGASLHATYAVERSLTELLQEFRMHEYYGSWGRKRLQHARLREWPVLQECVGLDVEGLCRRLPCRDVTLPASQPCGAARGGDVLAALMQIERPLSRRGLHVYWRALTPPEALVAVVHVIVPGAEDFHLVRTGHPVVPSGRGHAWVQARGRRAHSPSLVPSSHRTGDAGGALRGASEAATRLGARIALIPILDGPYPVVAARLESDRGGVLAEGLGKGRGQQATASAVFEALERGFCSGGIGPSGPGALLPAAEVALQPELAEDRVIGLLASTDPRGSVGCHEFEPLDCSGAAVWVPDVLFDPAYRAHPAAGDSVWYWRLLRYGTSSGNAAGRTLSEAVLHGLLETIERDAVSLLLLDRYVERGRPRALPDVASEALSDVRSIVMEAVGTPLVMLDATSDLCVPTVVALCADRRFPARLLGSGCSPSVAHAAERALTELLQLGSTYIWGTTDATDASGGDRLRGRSELLHRVYISDLAPTAKDMADGGGRRHDRSAAARTPGAVLHQVQGLLSARGFRAFRRMHTPKDFPVAVASVYVPGLARFYLARHGFEVVPTGRDHRRRLAAHA